MFQSKLASLFADPYGAPTLVRRLLTEQGLRHWRQYALSFTLMGVAAGCTAVSAYLIGQLVNQAYVQRDFLGIVGLGLFTVVLFALKGISSYGNALILSRIGNRIVAENQRKVFNKLLNESLGSITARHSSEFIARMSTGAGSASATLNMLITAAGRDFLSLVGLTAVMVFQDPILSLASLIVVPPAMLVLRKLIRRIHTVAKSRYTGGAQMLEAMQEAIHGVRVVKAFTLEETMLQRLDRSVDLVERESNRMARVSNRATPLMETLGGIAVALAVIYSGYRVIKTGANPGEFFAFIAAFLLAYEPAKRLARLNIDLHANLFGLKILYELIDGVPSEPIEDGKPPLQLTRGRIEFANVRFAYRTDEPVIRGMSFVAEPGKITALVGPSGGGKSTVLALLLRFYEPQSGSLLIDGQDILVVSRRSLRRQIGYVGQDVHLFGASVRENIVFGRLGASEEAIIAAARAANAHDFIMNFPRGYDTPVGERGLQLSGGQRQRIAIARALIKDAPIILLDEATASLDSESERQVQDAMSRLCEGRTTLVIAHRLATITHADRILVVEDGTIVESGRHEELLRKGGRYASFYQLQLRDQAPAYERSRRRRKPDHPAVRSPSGSEVDERAEALCDRSSAAAGHRGRGVGPAVSGPARLVRGTQLCRAHPGNGPG
jgi:ABC-type multidrug transport system fused ATPase/permease subunit